MATKLSPNFTLEELTRTDTGLPNEPPAEVLARLADILAPGLEAVRALLGNRPIRVNSGYRSEAVNRHVGGARASHHLKGYAADFTCADFGTPIAICHAIAASDLAFDQVIEEGTWVHISFRDHARGQVLEADGRGGYRQLGVERPPHWMARATRD